MALLIQDPLLLHSDYTFCCTCIADVMTSAAVLQRLQHRASQADLMLNQLREQLRYIRSKAGAYICRYYLLNDHEIIFRISEFISFKRVLVPKVSDSEKLFCDILNNHYGVFTLGPNQVAPEQHLNHDRENAVPGGVL